MIAPAHPLALPFADFVDHLRRQGFEIGVDHYVRLQSLLASLAGECTPTQLKTLLCPLFATSGEQQERFYRAFEQQYHCFFVKETPGAEEEARQHTLFPAKATAEINRPLRRNGRLIALVVAALVLVAAGVSFWMYRDIPPVSTGQATAPILAIPAPPSSPRSVEPEMSFVERNATALRFAAVALPLAFFFFHEIRRYRRRKLILQKERREKPPFVWPVRIAAAQSAYIHSDDFFSAARLLRRRESGEAQRLAIEESIAATIEASGFPVFRFKSVTRPPEYLVLVERATQRDHQAELFDDLARSLEREGVHIARYFYDGDPRVCYADRGAAGVHLAELRRRFSSHRLLLFGTGDKLLDPVTGKLMGWTDTFLGWPDRAMLTPVSPARWGAREVTLASRFIVLPSTAGALQVACDYFQSASRPQAKRWNDVAVPPPPALTDASAAPALLRRYLGEAAFQWLCACALYPDLQWDLTLYLGSLPCMEEGLIREETLLRLIQIPWFRTGAIPDDVRSALIHEISRDVDASARSAIIEVLEQNPPPPDTVASTRYQLDLAVQRLAISKADRKRRRDALDAIRKQRRRDALDAIRKLPRSQVVQDVVLLRLLETVPLSPLAFLLPRRLREKFYHNGIPAFGWTTGARMLATAGVMIIAFLPLRPAGDNSPVATRSAAVQANEGVLAATAPISGQETDTELAQSPTSTTLPPVTEGKKVAPNRGSASGAGRALAAAQRSEDRATSADASALDSLVLPAAQIRTPSLETPSTTISVGPPPPSGEVPRNNAVVSPTTTPPTASEATDGLRGVLDAYLRAVESGKTADIRRVYPAMTPRQQRTWDDFFRTVEKIRVGPATIGQPRIKAELVEFDVRTKIQFFERGFKRQQSTTLPFVMTIRRVDAGWVIAGIK